MLSLTALLLASSITLGVATKGVREDLVDQVHAHAEVSYINYFSHHKLFFRHIGLWAN